MKSFAVLLVAICLGPLAWLISLESSFVAAPSACTNQTKLPLYLISIAAFLLLALIAAYSLIQFRGAERGTAAEHELFVSPGRGLALAGLGLSGLCLLLVLAQSIPNFMLAACQ